MAKINITISLDDNETLEGALKAFGVGGAAGLVRYAETAERAVVENADVPQQDEPAKRRGRPPKAAAAESAASQPEPTSAAPASEEAAKEEVVPPTSSASPASGSEPIADLDGVKKALAKFLEKKSVGDAKAIFSEFGASSVGSLDAQHYAAVKAKFEAA